MKKPRRRKKKSFLDKVLDLVDKHFAPYVEADSDSQQSAVREVVKSLADSGVHVANKSNMPGKMAADIYLNAVNKLDGIVFTSIKKIPMESIVPKEKMN